jgi:HD domain
MAVAWASPNSLQQLPKTQAALGYAAELHAGQLRKADGAPFILHPREVASLLYDAGAPDDVIAAGALHDVIEKTTAVASDLRERFGSRITMLVLAVSEDEDIAGYAARKAALRDQVANAGEDALMLFAADKISKARELRIAGAVVPGALRPSAPAGQRHKRRLANYQRCLALLQERLPDSPLVAQLDAELHLSTSTHSHAASAVR